MADFANVDQMKIPNLVIVGTMALDTVQTPFGTAKNALGGSATYASLAASYFTKPSVVSIVGDDFSQQHLTLLRKHNIDLAGLERKGKTFRWSGSYEYDMNEATTLKTSLNALLEFNPSLPLTYKKAKYLFLANIDPALQCKVIDQLEPGVFILMDTMNYWIERSRKELEQAISRVHAVVINEGEARQLCNTPHLVQAARRILDMGPQYVIIKKGEHGSLLFSFHSHFSAPGYPLEEVRDPTGAGDSFAGGLAGYLAYTEDASETSIRRGIVYGSAIASFCAENFSVRYRSHTSKKEVEERYQTFKKIREF